MNLLQVYSGDRIKLDYKLQVKKSCFSNKDMAVKKQEVSEDFCDWQMSKEYSIWQFPPFPHHVAITGKQQGSDVKYATLKKYRFR